MALTKNFRVYLFCFVAALAISACAKKDSDFKARKNAAGATDVSPNASQRADQAAAAAGYVTDILLIQTPVSTGAGLSVTSYVSVNNSDYQITTTHTNYGTTSAAGATVTQNFSGADFQITGICSNQYCSPYYLIINITRGGQPVKQTAEKKFFYYSGDASQQDLFLSRGPSEFMTVDQIINTLDAGIQTDSSSF